MQVTGHHITRRVSSTKVMTLDEQFPPMPVGIGRAELLTQSTNESTNESTNRGTMFDMDRDGRITVEEMRRFAWKHSAAAN